MIRTTSFESVRLPVLASSKLNRHPMLLIRHFRPIRWTSVTPCGILLQLSWASVAPVAMAASSMSRSWNFSSPICPPKNPPVLVKPGTILGRRARVAKAVLMVNADPCRPPFKPPLTARLYALRLLNLALNDLIFCHIFVELFSHKYWKSVNTGMRTAYYISYIFCLAGRPHDMLRPPSAESN